MRCLIQTREKLQIFIEFNDDISNPFFVNVFLINVNYEQSFFSDKKISPFVPDILEIFTFFFCIAIFSFICM
jgi:hypothetical protein